MDITAYVDQRLAAMRDTPGMFGSPDTVEVLAIQIVEMEGLFHDPTLLSDDPRYVLELFIAGIRKRFGTGASPVHAHVKDPAESAKIVVAIATEVRVAIQRRLQDESNAFFG